MKLEEFVSLDRPSLDLVPGDSPVLFSVASPVESEEWQYLAPVTERMIELCDMYGGIGLAAPQIGISKRFFVIHYGGIDTVVINPEIIDQTTNVETDSEGCLSYPGTRVPVRRHTDVKVSFTNLQGKRHKRWMRGMTARIFQHELDHLNGITIVIPAGPL